MPLACPHRVTAAIVAYIEENPCRERRRLRLRIDLGQAPHGKAKGMPYAASRSVRALSSLATWMDFAMRSHFSTLIRSQDGSNSYHARPCRAEVGCAWWLLCQPSPNVTRATHQLLRESSRVAKRREPHMCVAELTSQVPCRETTVRRKPPQRSMGRPPTRNSTTPSTTGGIQ